MPNNPQSTFASSHLQRLNSFLPGMHALHSCVKVIDRNGITTKFIPTKRYGLDYITVSLVVPKYDQSYAIIPSTSMARAKSLSPHLIHQKCGHFHNGHVEELARRELIAGLPSKLPRMTENCPICLATKLVHHPRRPHTDYTLLAPCHQIHADWFFLGEVSIRGHTSIICLKCANSKKM